MRNFTQHLKGFFARYLGDPTIELYNEFSVYHEIGNHLQRLFTADYRINYMRPPEFFGIRESLVKSGIDIAIFDEEMGRYHAIEVVFIKDEPHLEKMFEICTGIRFMEELVENGWRESYVLLIADLPEERHPDGAYPHPLFRGETVIEGAIQSPDEQHPTILDIQGTYTIEWNALDDGFHYAVVVIPSPHNS